MLPYAAVSLGYTAVTTLAASTILEEQYRLSKEEHDELLANDFETKFERIFTKGQEKLFGEEPRKGVMELQTERAKKLIDKILSKANEEYVNKPVAKAVDYILNNPAELRSSSQPTPSPAKVIEAPTLSYMLNHNKPIDLKRKEKFPPTSDIFVKKKKPKIEEEPLPIKVVEEVANIVDETANITEKAVIGSAIIGTSAIVGAKITNNIFEESKDLIGKEIDLFTKKDSQLKSINSMSFLDPFYAPDFDQRLIDQYGKKANGDYASQKLRDVEGIAKKFLLLYAKDSDKALQKIATDYSIKDIEKILSAAKEGLMDPNADIKHYLPKDSIEFINRPDIARVISSVYNSPGEKINWINASKLDNLKNSKMSVKAKPDMQFETYLAEAKQAADNNQVDTAAAKYGKAIHELQLGHELKEVNKGDLNDVRNYLRGHNKLEKYEGKYHKVITDKLSEVSTQKYDKAIKDGDVPTPASIYQSTLTKPEKEMEKQDIVLGAEKKGISIAEELKDRDYATDRTKVDVIRTKDGKYKVGFPGEAKNIHVPNLDMNVVDVPVGVVSKYFNIDSTNPEKPVFSIKPGDFNPFQMFEEIQKAQRNGTAVIDEDEKGGKVVSLPQPNLQTTSNANELANAQVSSGPQVFAGHPGFVEPVLQEAPKDSPIPAPVFTDANGLQVNTAKEPVLPLKDVATEVGNLALSELFSVQGAQLAASTFGGSPYAAYAFTSAYNNLLKELILSDRPYRAEASKIFNQIKSGTIAGFEKYKELGQPENSEEGFMQFLRGESNPKRRLGALSGDEGPQKRARSELNELGFEGVNISPMTSIDNQNPISGLVSEAFLDRSNKDLIHQEQESYNQWIRNSAPYPVR